MAISFNASSTASADSAGSAVSSKAITIPSGVTAGDIVFLVAEGVAAGATAPGFSVSSTGTAWTQVGTTQTTTNSSDANGLAVFWIKAASGDLGLSVTVNSTGVSSFMSLAMASWTGANGSTPIDVSGSTGVSNPASSITCPSKTTGVASDWALYMCGGLCESGAVVVPSGTTSRLNHRSTATVTAVIADSNGSVGTSGTSIGGGTFTISGGGTTNWMCAFTIGLAPPGGTSANVTGVAAAVTAAGGAGSLSAGADITGTGAAAAATSGPGVAVTLTVTFSGSSGGINTYSTSFAGNGSGPQDMRVVVPTSPGPYPHAFLWLLNPSTGQDTTFGDPIATITAGGWQNQYNLTLIEPGYADQPWIADNPDDPTVLQESLLLTLVAWANANLATGGEEHYLIGFSATGYGDMSAIFRNPGVFFKAAGWDIPATNTAYTDGSAGDVYGDQTSYASNYQLSSANIARWAAASNFTSVNRIWVGGYNAEQTQTEAYDALLTTRGVLHTFNEVSESAHNWAPSPGWVGSAIAAMLGVIIAGTGAAVTAAGGAGTPSASANVTGTGAAATAAGGTGSPSASADIAGVAAAATAAGGTGSLTVTAVADAGLSGGAGTAQSGAAAITVTPGLAPGAGAAQADAAAVTADAGLAAGTGTAQPPAPIVAAAAGLAVGTGAALQPTVNTSGNTTANAGLATATGPAQQPVPVIGVNAGLAAATSAAQAAMAAVTPVAGLPSGTGVALQSAAAVTVAANLAAGTGTAQQPSVSTPGNTTAPAGLATGTGVAWAPVVTIVPGAGLASGTGVALGPSVVHGVLAPAGLAAATGTSQQPAISAAAAALLAAAAAAALGPVAGAVARELRAGLLAGSAASNDAYAGTAASTNDYAGSAS